MLRTHTHFTIQMTSLYEMTPRELRWRSRRRPESVSTEQTRTPSPEEVLYLPDSAPESQCERSARKRQRKSTDQIQILKEKLHSNPVWTKQDIAYLARRTGLSESQVYKWSWDFRKKTKGEPERVSPQLENCKFLECEELLMPTLLDSCLYEVQRAYRLDLNQYRLRGCTPSRYLMSPTRLVFGP